MRRLAAGVALVALLTLLVVVVTHTSEKRAEGQETTTVLMVSVECPCGGECEAHARVACNLEPSYAEADTAVLKLPIRNVAGHRSDIQSSDHVVVVDFRLISGTYDIVDYGSRSWRTRDVVGNRERGVTSVLKLPYHRGGRLNVDTILGNYTHGTSEASVGTGRFSAGVL